MFTVNSFSTSDFIGFDSLLTQYNSASQNPGGYPPYNVIQHDVDVYEVQIALAGFSRKDIDITFQDGVLSVSGKGSSDKGEYLHRGIALREFKRDFRLAEFIEVRDARFQDGILSIKLERVLPEEKKPRKIEIAGDKQPEFIRD